MRPCFFFFFFSLFSGWSSRDFCLTKETVRDARSEISFGDVTCREWSRRPGRCSISLLPYSRLLIVTVNLPLNLPSHLFSVLSYRRARHGRTTVRRLYLRDWCRKWLNQCSTVGCSSYFPVETQSCLNCIPRMRRLDRQKMMYSWRLVSSRMCASNKQIPPVCVLAVWRVSRLWKNSHFTSTGCNTHEILAVSYWSLLSSRRPHQTRHIASKSAHSTAVE